MILVATSGYAYKDWKGRFYPENMKDGDMLAFYSREFPFTEVNSSYYSMPTPYMFYHMMKKTPGNFIFVVKAYGGMTHQRDLGDITVGRFHDALKPLVEAGRLGCVLAQFPYSFHNNEKNRDYLKKLRERMKDLPLAVEFRSDDWLRLEVIRLLRENDMAFVCVDEPPIRGLLPPVVVATSSIGYVRFHGRNIRKWYNHEKSYERYDYLYTEMELSEWVPRIRELSRKTKVVFIAMNNHFNASAVINARQLLGLLKEAGNI
ncbi:protein of unknown function DUF72 [Thermosediminibacter oceani DSM 16646]|uniref:DUF72 domain-containing protein n=1 Tax=Thermosediminibacter oceani (strain ATCC BAA-1034 / DSM 16646 / JW/IW-1228P) TaxID=555079 RepID=D9S1G4_THEOJ|nr:DUF72 domain-containing protein [Thermosediminibacter oceani]ADL07241.1 protein of unknown function DUF72 [Thermosediminibacter oceani DSM 16646]